MKSCISTIILILGLTFVLTGCENDSDRAAATQHSAENPSRICVMPDGRILYRITIDCPNTYHYVYFFGTNDTTTVTVNYSVYVGKTTRNETIVLDGQTYMRVPQK